MSSRTSSLRATDADRSQTATLIDQALSEGQLASGEHEQRLQTALRATTLRELHALVDDLQSDDSLRPVPTVASLRAGQLGHLKPMALALVAGAVVIALIVAFVVAHAIWGAITPDGTDPDDFGNGGYLTPDGIAQVLGAVDREYDSIDEITIHSTSVSLTVADPTEPRRELRLNYRNGSFDQWTDSARDKDTTGIDPATIPPKIVAGLVLGAVQTIGQGDAVVQHISISAPDQGDPFGRASEPEIGVWVSNEFNEGGHFKANFKGEFLSVYRSDN